MNISVSDIAGYHESRKRGPVADDASRLYRLDLSTYL